MPETHREDEFSRLVEPHRAALGLHCYRMLGSLQDAEDALQETLLRAWRALPRFGGRPWLYRIATNVCLTAIDKRSRRSLPIEHGTPAGPGDDPGEPSAEPIWLEPYPDAGIPDEPAARYEQREAVELAFVAALQHLPGTQRAVLILRDVLGFSAREAAEQLDTTTASVNSALQRARAAIDGRLPARSQQATARALGDDAVRALVDRYLDAWERGDVPAIAAMLAEDATFAMPPYALWWRGRGTIAAFAAEPVHRYRRTRANAQPANATYRLDPATGGYKAEAIEVLTLDEHGLIAHMTAFMLPDLFPRFGLQTELP